MPGKNRKGEGFKILLRKITYSFEALIFPSFCHICNTPLDYKERLICSECLKKIKPIGDSVCKICGRPMNSIFPSQLCLSCVESPPPFEMHRSFSLYEGVMREIILLIKFKRMKFLSRILAKIAFEYLKTNPIFDCDCVIAVPISKKRIAKRGFNQSEVFASELSKMINKKLLKNVLIKKIDTIPQSVLSLKERRKNIIGSFEVRHQELIKEKRILLVDDIYTTGSTVTECCKVLIKSGVREVKVFTIARGTGDFLIPLEMLDS